MRTWTYKDGNRNKWTVNARPCRRECDEHLQWDVTIHCEGACRFDGRITGQYKDPPHLNDCLAAWMAGTTAVCLGMAKYAKLKTSVNKP